MAALPPIRTLSVEQFPPDVRGWVERALLVPLNKVLASNHDALDRRLSLGNLNAQLFDVAVEVPADAVDDWSTPTLNSPWQAYSASQYPTLRVRKSADGRRCILEGFLQGNGAATGSTIATLDATYRPALTHIIGTLSKLSTVATYQPVDFRVGADGTLKYIDGASGPNFWVTLNGLSWEPADTAPPDSSIASCWPKYAASALSGPAKALWLVNAVDADGDAVQPLGVSWENAVKDKKPALKISNVPGLSAGHKYTLTFLALGGD